MASNQISDILLTIAIPTYNRSFYLERNLESILMQYSKEMSIEIFISDNASTDNTQEVVEKFTNLGLPIRYIKNNKNEGSENNIFQCYNEGKGHFILVLGDDDILINDAIHKVLHLISKEGNIGVIFLRAHGFVNNYLKELPTFVKTGYFKYDNSIDFIKKIKYNITFISSNIINRNFFDKNMMLKYSGTNLTHSAAILDIIIKNSNNIYIDELLLAGQADNSGGYNFFEIFTDNLLKICKEVVGEGITDMMMNKMIKEHFPYYILKLKKNEMANYEIDISFLKNLSKKYVSYWIYNYPIFILPYYLANSYCIGIKVFNKIFSFFNRKKNMYKFLD